jgi:hypothetical protein
MVCGSVFHRTVFHVVFLELKVLGTGEGAGTNNPSFGHQSQKNHASRGRTVHETEGQIQETINPPQRSCTQCLPGRDPGWASWWFAPDSYMHPPTLYTFALPSNEVWVELHNVRATPGKSPLHGQGIGEEA